MIFFQSSLKPASTRNVSQNEGRLLPLWINETLQFPSSARLSAAPFNDGLGYRYLLLQRGGTPGDPLGNGKSERSTVLPGVPNAAVTTAAVLFDVLLILPKHFPPRSDVINDFRRSRVCRQEQRPCRPSLQQPRGRPLAYEGMK